jgi:hypothetical protein
MKNYTDMAIKKASQSSCTYKISAMGFNKKGDYVGSAINKKKKCGHGLGLHAEIELIKKYNKRISTILICRVNNKGKLLPIDSCVTCKKICEKLNIKLITVKGRKDD